MDDNIDDEMYAKMYTDQFTRESAVHSVIAAWTNPGPYPEYHYRMQASLREQWPALGFALDRLAKTL